MSEDTQSAPKREGAKPPAAPPPATGELKSPREWALLTGNGPKAPGQNQWTGPGFSRPMGSVEHEAAAVLHGWREHEHETGKPIELSRADYEAALKASHPADEYELDAKGEPKRDRDGNPVLKVGWSGVPKPHPAALSPYRGQLGKLRIGEKPQAVKS